MASLEPSAPQTTELTGTSQLETLATDKNEERQARFKALQARAVSYRIHIYMYIAKLNT